MQLPSTIFRNVFITYGLSLSLSLHTSILNANRATEPEFPTIEMIVKEKKRIKIKNDSEFVINNIRTQHMKHCTLIYLFQMHTANGKEHAFLMIYTHTLTHLYIKHIYVTHIIIISLNCMHSFHSLCSFGFLWCLSLTLQHIQCMRTLTFHPFSNNNNLRSITF